MKPKVFAFGCNLCHKSFKELKSLGKHVEKIHSLDQSEKEEAKKNTTSVKIKKVKTEFNTSSKGQLKSE